MENRKRKASAAAGWAGSFCGLWLLGSAVLFGACRDSPGTALYVTIDFPPSLLMDQLLVSGTVAGIGFGPRVLPEQPERLLANGETFRVLLPSVPDRSKAELTVEGLRQGAPVALGTSEVEVREGSEVDVTVRLEPDGGFCPNCANGCCMNGVCTPSTFDTCGSGGIACVKCELRSADSCASQGACACGQGPACNPATTDQCIGGECKCGSGTACGFGQECVAGRCECTPTSCGGCCFSNICVPGNNVYACGQNGTVCMRCTNACSSTGTCT